MLDTKLKKILLTIAVLGFVTWFGGSIIRGMIGYAAFDAKAGLPVKDSYPEEVLMLIVNIYASTGLYTNIGYLLWFIAGIIFLISMKGYIRQRGWLFMSAALFFVIAPVELYKLYMDAKLSMALFFEPGLLFTHRAIQDFFIEKFRNNLLVSGSGISMMAAITIILLFIWKPLDKQYSKNIDNEDGENK
ncbi:MAG: hypothetical protein ACLFR2_09520 [Candidatus Kapaibacterium sp.]